MRTRWRAALLLPFLALAAASSCSLAPPAARRAPEGEGVLLQVWSSPAGARIILDGKPTGFRTPTAFPVPPGSHRVIISLAGHRNAEQRVTLEPGEPQRVEARLTPLAAGALNISSLPGGAAVTIDGEPFEQRTPVLVRDLAVGTHTVELRRLGSEDWCQAVVITGNRTLEVRAQLAPARRNLGALAVQSQPPHAAVALDGRSTGKFTPEQILDVPAGTYRIELTLEGYRPWTGTAVVREGQTENLLVTLRHLPAQEVGAAHVETDPPGAAIALNGVVLRQKTPADLERLAPGTFPLTLSRPGSQPWSGELTVQPGQLVRLDVRLEPLGRYGGSIRVTSEPAGAAVSVDGADAGATTPTLLPNLPPCGHRLTVSLPGYRPWTRTVEVGEGTMETVHVRLFPQPYAITAAVAAESGEQLELVLQAVGPDGAPAAGALELDAIAATGSWRVGKVTLVDGKARAALVPAATALEVPISIGLGAQRDVFIVRRTSTGWEVVSP